jgi:hypothetical protein
MSLANDCDEMAAYILKEDEKYSIVADVLVRAAAALRSARPEAAFTTVEFCGKPAAAPCAIEEQCQFGKDRDNIIEACAQIAERTYPRGEAHTYASENADRYIALEDACEVAAERIRALKQSKPQNDSSTKE